MTTTHSAPMNRLEASSVISLTLPAIREWALSLPANKPVGVIRSPCNCPLAEYIRSHGGTNVSILDTVSYILNGKEVSQFRSATIVKLISGIDYGLPYGEKIMYPHTLLQILEGIPDA